jgi:phage terminase small subunit|tara:strand:+ start:394 stop:1017 length:624 start_codon:yes stop_codon:yes gene_type:complete
MTKKYVTTFTAKQRKYIDLYCSKYGEWSATQCAIAAGYEKDSAHTRANELMNWRLYPEVRKEIDMRLEDSRKVWEIDRNKSMANLFRIGQEAGEKGQYGVKAKCEELRGKLAGLYIEKQMILSKEISEEDMDAKWKSLFQSKEEMIAVNNQLAEQVWNDDEKMDYGKAKDNAAKELGLNKEKPEPEAEEMRKYNERRTKERAKGLKK